MTPSPRRGLPPASVSLRKSRAMPALQGGGRLRPLRLQGGGPLRVAGVLVASLNGTVAGSISRRPMRAGGTRSPEPPPTSGGCSSATRASSFPS